MIFKRKNGKIKQRGSSLIESLVSLVVLSFGTIGVAGLQVTSKQANLEAQQQLIATFLANDMVEKMRNNSGVLDTYAGENVGGSSISSQPLPNCSGVNACTAVQLASQDRWLWEQGIDGATIKKGIINTGGLVSPKGCISNNNGQVQIVISWYGKDSLSDVGTGTNGVSDCGTAGDNRRQIVIDTFIS
ncbi:hypothetical protein MNBD_GAMMA16-678 [hydrothermal vent metagenome]|uniref:Type IV pilin Tt1218-like domain-containing protein n=1 Tax=hydrothermal vent metagenome TaxID=652676 RepID=A0A3B0Z4S1_9ZZZZ